MRQGNNQGTGHPDLTGRPLPNSPTGTQPAAPDEGYAPGYTGLRAYYLIALLTTLNMLNFIDRNLLSSFVVDIRRDLELSYFQFSLLTGLVFSASYTVAGLFMGALADRRSRTKLIACGLFVWSGFTALTGLAGTFLHLVLARSVMAIGESTLTPASISMTADVFPKRRQGLAVGIFTLGLPLGAGGSLLVAGVLGPIVGWWGCFLILGAIGVVLSIPIFFLKDPARRSVPGPAEHARPTALVQDLKTLLRTSPGVRYVILAGTLIIFSQAALIIDQAWLVEERGYATSEAQLTFGSIVLLAGLVGSVLGGVLSDMFYQRFTGGRMLFLTLTVLLLWPVIILYRFLEPDTAAFYACAALGAMSITLPFGAVFSGLSDFTPARMRGLIIGLLLMVTMLLGTAAGSMWVGWLADYLIAQNVDSPLTWAIMTTSAAGVLAIPLFFMAWRTHATSIAIAQSDRLDPQDQTTGI